MDFKFIKWYTQALGSTIGILSCLYSYTKGILITYSNMKVLLFSASFITIIFSFLLLPLCMISLFLGITKVCNSAKTFIKVSAKSINEFIVLFTILIGLLSTSKNFLIPSIILGVSLLVKESKEIEEAKDNDCSSSQINNLEHLHKT